MKWLKRILFIRRHINKNDVVTQVGFSLDRLYSDVFPLSWFAKKLVIVEPDPRAYFKLLKREWLMKKNYYYINKIVTSTDTDYIYLAPDTKHNTIMGGSRNSKMKVDKIELNHFLESDIIILTCNGSEYDCLLSGKNLLHKGTKFIIANANLEIEKLLLSYNYKLKIEYVNRQKLLIADKK